MIERTVIAMFCQLNFSSCLTSGIISIIWYKPCEFRIFYFSIGYIWELIQKKDWFRTGWRLLRTGSNLTYHSRPFQALFQGWNSGNTIFLTGQASVHCNHTKNRILILICIYSVFTAFDKKHAESLRLLVYSPEILLFFSFFSALKHNHEVSCHALVSLLT